MLRFPDEAPLKTMHGFGHSFERLCHAGNDWLIAHNVLARLRMDVTRPPFANKTGRCRFRQRPVLVVSEPWRHVAAVAGRLASA
jgi:hypothetical protein